MSTFVPAPAQSEATLSWSARNQRWLVEQFQRWCLRIDAHVAQQTSDQARETVPMSDVNGGGADTRAVSGQADPHFQPAALRLAAVFGLSSFETDLLVLAAGVEIDAGVAAAVARAQVNPFGQTVRLDYSLALTILPEAHWDALSPLGPLRHWSLVSVDTSESVMHARLRIDERVLHYLTGVPAIDERLSGLIRIEEQAVNSDDALRGAATRIVASIGEAREPLVMFADATFDPSRLRNGRHLARVTFARMGLRTLWADDALVGLEARDLVQTARHLDREAALTDSGVALALTGDSSQHANAARLIRLLRGPVMLLGSLGDEQLTALSNRPVFRFNVPVSRWTADDPWPPALRQAAEQALQQFRVEPAVVDQALASIAGTHSGDIGDERQVGQAVWSALREAARGGLDTLAQRVESRATLDDLVAPPAVVSQLREIGSQLRHRHVVYDEWGFGERQSRGLGIAALFVGESGTGKTLAAEIIANEVQLDLYRIDLARVVSKYIGETEKNLSHVFEAAEHSGAVLLFDEADALFGKRSEVKDSHDRYANIELAYLLQRIESYRGLAILTTNMKSALDRAFLRRLRFVVQFPFPDQPARIELWRRQFPAKAPLGDDVDWHSLARLQLSGGQIRSIALNAAFQAAAHGERIDQAILQAAVRAELAKLERPLNDLAIVKTPESRGASDPARSSVRGPQ